MRYDINLTIENRYGASTDGARNLVRILPLNLPGHQQLISGKVEVSPRPDWREDRVDFFGNAVTEIACKGQLHHMSVTLQARVDRSADLPGEDLSPTLAGLAVDLTACNRLDGHSPHHFRAASPRVHPTPEMTAFARAIVTPGMSVLELTRALGGALYREMRFEAGVTDVNTPPEAAFANRHGVCQDFSHVMIACLRGIGVPAGYVSGFLRTIPPEGQPRLEGADAMHAWVRVWCGVAMGWVEFDPTNDQLVASDHVVVGYGRDYADVAPIRGILRTAGQQTSHHLVDVIPLDAG